MCVNILSTINTLSFVPHAIMSFWRFVRTIFCLLETNLLSKWKKNFTCVIERLWNIVNLLMDKSLVRYGFPIYFSKAWNYDPVSWPSLYQIFLTGFHGFDSRPRYNKAYTLPVMLLTCPLSVSLNLIQWFDFFTYWTISQFEDVRTNEQNIDFDYKMNLPNKQLVRVKGQCNCCLCSPSIQG